MSEMDIELLLNTCNWGSSFVLSNYLRTQRNFAAVLSEIKNEGINFSSNRGFNPKYIWHPIDDKDDFTSEDNKPFLEVDVDFDFALLDLEIPWWVEDEYEEFMYGVWELYESMKSII
jgi:hypothetical protein